MDYLFIIVMVVVNIMLVTYVSRKIVILKEQNTKLSLKNTQLKNEIEEANEVPKINKEELISAALEESKTQIKEEQDRLRLEHELTVERLREKLTQELQKAQQESATLIQAEAVKTQDVIAAHRRKQREEQAEIDNFRVALDALIEAARRAESEEMAHGFYMVQFTNEDLEELKELTSIANRYGRIAVPLRKAVWEIYYQKRVKDMISRVVGTGKVSGIYKITNIKNKRTYIGQAVDIGNRWTTHIKRVLGVESETSNKLYPAMRSEGLENFTFEIVEITDDLKNREAYWQEFYKVKEWGYNVRAEKANTRNYAPIEDTGFSLFD